MRLTILGKSPAWTDAGGACSGYLVEEGNAAVLVDCGNGVFGKLRERLDYAEVDAVAITHLHGDHVLDLVPFSYALKFGPAGRRRDAPPRLIAPRGAEAFFRRLDGTWDDEGLIVGSFALEEYEPHSETTVGELALTTHPVPHIGATHAIELTGAAGRRIVLGADGRFSDELIAAASGADLLVAEATLPETPLTEDVHMSAEQAGRLAAEAGAGRLVLTHISDELDVERSRRIAAEAFGGDVTVAASGAEYTV